MSEVVSIVVYYDYGTVRTNESGVDLSEFANVATPNSGLYISVMCS